MRLIDADALKEKKVYCTERHEKVVPVSEIDWMPTVNAKRMEKKIEFIESYIKVGNSDYQWQDNHGELVRCGDCQYCYYASNRIPSEQTYACGKHGINVTMDWFCADGERRVSQK